MTSAGAICSPVDWPHPRLEIRWFDYRNEARLTAFFTEHLGYILITQGDCAPAFDHALLFLHSGLRPDRESSHQSIRNNKCGETIPSQGQQLRPSTLLGTSCRILVQADTMQSWTLETTDWITA